MALIEWNSDLSVNVAEIDKEHKKLVGLVNELHEAMKSGKGKEVLGKILTELEEYTKTHFSHEEEILGKHGYPAIFSHKKEHQNLISAVQEYKKKGEAGNLFTLEISKFLKDWLTNHILKTDKNYSSFLNSKGIK